MCLIRLPLGMKQPRVNMPLNSINQSIKLLSYDFLPTLLHEQDATQSQLFKLSLTGLVQSFTSPRQVAK